jgi:hypothetical protein
MPEAKHKELSAGLRRPQPAVRLLREHWPSFLIASAVSIFASWLVTWLLLSQQIASLQQQNGLLQGRIDALASTPPSEWRRLSDRTRGLLLAGLEHPDNEFKLLVVYAAPDSESRQYAAQFVDAARLVGIEVRPREAALPAADTGLVVATQTATPSEPAERLKEILSSAGLEVRYARWARPAVDDAPVDFALFVGPKPW